MAKALRSLSSKKHLEGNWSRGCCVGKETFSVACDLSFSSIFSFGLFSLTQLWVLFMFLIISRKAWKATEA